MQDIINKLAELNVKMGKEPNATKRSNIQKKIDALLQQLSPVKTEMVMEPGESMVNPASVAKTELVQPGVFYIVAFDILGSHKSSKGHDGWKTTLGGFYEDSESKQRKGSDEPVPYGSFKMTQIVMPGADHWSKILYGPDLAAQYGEENGLEGLYIKITNDWGSNFANKLLARLQELEADLKDKEGDNAQLYCQVWAKVFVPNKPGAFMRAENRDKAQYLFRVDLAPAGDDFPEGFKILTKDQKDLWVSCDDSPYTYNNSGIWMGLKTHKGDPISIDPSNMRQYAIESRRGSQAKISDQSKPEEANKSVPVVPSDARSKARQAADKFSLRPAGGKIIQGSVKPEDKTNK